MNVELVAFEAMQNLLVKTQASILLCSSPPPSFVANVIAKHSMILMSKSFLLQ
jgi:hypothetical protein